MTFEEFLRCVVAIVDDPGMSYMLTGSPERWARALGIEERWNALLAKARSEQEP